MSKNPQPAAAVEVFFSYAHEDHDLCRKLQEHLSFLRRDKKVALWYDGEIRPGDDWRGELEERLNSADVILLLISAAFANSDFCYEVETGRAMERHNAGEAVVVPIILHPCDWQRTSFAKLQALPGGDQAISEWRHLEKALYEVARGVREVVERILDERAAASPSPAAEKKAGAPAPAVASAHVPPPPAIDFVPRKDREGRDLVERLRRELTQDPKRLVVLWGEGGVGKTTIAAEAARVLSSVYGDRVVWVSAEKRNDFTYPTLLNELAARLDSPEIAKLATDPKEQAIIRLIAAAPTLVIFDNFETVSPDGKNTCADFLAARAHCPALITTRERVAHDSARHIHIESMSDEEAHQFVARWIAQEAHDPRFFDGLDRDEIIRAADARPYVLQWVLAQINLALEPRAVLEELSRAEGEVGERVFTNSLDLPQLGDDGRDTLLALSLFIPSASRPALAEVAGFGDDRNRLDEAVKRLAALRLVETSPGGRRLYIEGLTRSLAQSRFSADQRADEFRRRYVAHFLRHAQTHARETPEDLGELDAEKDNLLGAMDAAFRMKDWQSVMGIRHTLNHFFLLRGYWDVAIKSGELAETAAREAKHDASVPKFKANIGLFHRNRGENDEAAVVYKEALELFRKFEDEGGIALCLNQLGIIAGAQGNLDEANRLFKESLEIQKRLANHDKAALTVWNLGTIAIKQGNLEEAKRLLTESLNIFRGLEKLANVADVLNWLGVIAVRQSEFKEARRLYVESLQINKRLGHQSGIAYTARNLGLLEEKEANIAEAAQLLRESLLIFEKLGSPEADRSREELARIDEKAN